MTITILYTNGLAIKYDNAGIETRKDTFVLVKEHKEHPIDKNSVVWILMENK